MEDRVRLGQYVMATRKKMGYPERTDWAPAIGISAKTLGKLERGQHVGPGTLADVELFFGWAPGSCRNIMRGGEPITEKQPAAVALTDTEIIAMTSEQLARHYIQLVKTEGAEEAEDRMVYILTVRRNARRSVTAGPT